MKKRLVIVFLFLTGVICVVLFLRLKFDETPICWFDSSYPIENWNENTSDRYCIMRRVVTSQELKGWTEEEVIRVLGKPTSEYQKETGRKSARYVTDHGFLIGWYFLTIGYQDGEVEKMWEELD